MNFWGWHQQLKIKCTTATTCSLPKNVYNSSSLDYQICQHLPFNCFICWCSSCIGISFFNIIRHKIEALFLLHGPLQIFWNHTDAVDGLVVVHASFDDVVTFRILFHNWYILCFPGLNMRPLLLKLVLCNAWHNAYHSFTCNTMSQ